MLPPYKDELCVATSLEFMAVWHFGNGRWAGYENCGETHLERSQAWELFIDVNDLPLQS